jgi:hypothetical protein
VERPTDTKALHHVEALRESCWCEKNSNAVKPRVATTVPWQQLLREIVDSGAPGTGECTQLAFSICFEKSWPWSASQFLAVWSGDRKIVGFGADLLLRENIHGYPDHKGNSPSPFHELWLPISWISSSLSVRANVFLLLPSTSPIFSLFAES